MFTLPVLRYMKDYGLTHEQLAYVAVAQRRWAAKNPRAMYRDPITVDDVLSSRVISSPLHLLDCCIISDGGGALVVTSAERARDLKKKPAYILGVGEALAADGGCLCGVDLADLRLMAMLPQIMAGEMAKPGGKRGPSEVSRWFFGRFARRSRPVWCVTVPRNRVFRAARRACAGCRTRSRHENGSAAVRTRE